ncbi:MAG: hypothetical protein N2515_01350, partial [Deltaproteobacteria bacterium]|nr:hypothetical protein [Deltaproteobacteria bacterium]
QVIWEAFSLPPLKRQEPETSTQENELNRERKEDRLAIARLALSFGLEAMALMSWFIFGLLLAVKKQGGGLQIGIAGLAVLLALPCVWGLSQLFHVLRLKKGKLSSAHLASALSSLSPLFALKTIVFFGVLASTCFVLSLLVSLFALR